MNQPSSPTPASSRGTAAQDKSVALLAALARSRGAATVSELAGQLGLPASTARRIVAGLAREGLLARSGHGRYVAGWGLVELARTADPCALLAQAARPPLKALAARRRATAHLGVLEGGMVTYLVKQEGGGAPIFTREGAQLEAYGSGVGKVLLAHLAPAEREAYLAGGSLVALTVRTLVDPARLREALEAVRRQGYALDDGEVADDIACLAAPVRDGAGAVVAALSVSGPRGGWDAAAAAELVGRLQVCAQAVGAELRVCGSSFG